MKAVRKLTAVAVLTCLLALSVSAGEIHTGGYAPPPPPPDDPKAAAVAGEEPDVTGDLTADILTALLNGLLIVL